MRWALSPSSYPPMPGILTAEAKLPVVCVETRHMQAVLKAQINKTDRNDARGIAQMMQVGLYRPVHVKTLRSQKLRMQLTIGSCCNRRPSPSRTICAVVTSVSRSEGRDVKFEARIKELVENLPDLAVPVEPLLVVRRVLREQVRHPASPLAGHCPG